MTKDGIEERGHRVAFGGHFRLGIASHAATKKVGEVALIVICPKLKEKIENLIQSLLWFNASTIDLIDKNNRPQSLLQCLL